MATALNVIRKAQDTTNDDCMQRVEIARAMFRKIRHDLTR
jgi:hypothetical protein